MSKSFLNRVCRYALDGVIVAAGCVALFTTISLLTKQHNSARSLLTQLEEELFTAKVAESETTLAALKQDDVLAARAEFDTASQDYSGARLFAYQSTRGDRIPIVSHELRAKLAEALQLANDYKLALQLASSKYGGVSNRDSLKDLLKHFANVAFNAPPRMTYGDTIKIELLLDRRKSAAELDKLLKEPGRPENARINISDKMEAQLTGDAFHITPITPTTQPVSTDATTQWSWEIRADRLHLQRVHLTVNALLEIQGEKSPRCVQTFEKTIEVRVTSMASALHLVEDHWKLAAAAGGTVVTIAGWMIRRLFSVGGQIKHVDKTTGEDEGD